MLKERHQVFVGLFFLADCVALAASWLILGDGVGHRLRPVLICPVRGHVIRPPIVEKHWRKE